MNRLENLAALQSKRKRMRTDLKELDAQIKAEIGWLQIYRRNMASGGINVDYDVSPPVKAQRAVRRAWRAVLRTFRGGIIRTTAALGAKR